MTVDRSTQDGAGGKVKRARAARQHSEHNREPHTFDVARSGDWMPAEELRDAALAVLREDRDVTVNLGKIDHLDASALQILLAFDAEQKKCGRSLQLANASAHLRQWFDYAGVADHFSMTGPKSDE